MKHPAANPAASNRRQRRVRTAAWLLLWALVTPAVLPAAQPHFPRGGEPPGRGGAAGPIAPVNRVARNPEHPLEPALRIAETCRETLENVRDYEAMFSKWDIVGGRGYAHTMRMKFRTQPMSVYLKFEQPHAGREVLYVEGRNDGNLLARETGLAGLIGTVSLRPDSPRALSESKHPITHIGMANLVGAIIDQWNAESRLDGVEVLYYPDAKLRGMECKVIEATHHRPGRGVTFHRTRLYIDKQSNLPVRVEQFGFPERPGEKPPLLEQYTYWNIRTNLGLKDIDFDVRNPAYGF